MADFFNNLGNDIKNGANTVGNGISDGVNTVTGGVKQGVEFVADIAFQGTYMGETYIKDGATYVWTGTQWVTKDAWNHAIDILGGMAGQMGMVKVH